jgi:hypothetical protein
MARVDERLSGAIVCSYALPDLLLDCVGYNRSIRAHGQRSNADGVVDGVARASMWQRAAHVECALFMLLTTRGCVRDCSRGRRADYKTEMLGDPDFQLVEDERCFRGCHVRASTWRQS